MREVYMRPLERDDGGILILLVYVIAIVLLLSVTVMSTTVMSYKMRLSNITYVSNAYMSDGGLDEANWLAILTYEKTSSETMEYITGLIQKTHKSIDKINAGEKSYVLSPYRKYIHPLDLTLKQGEVIKEYERHFRQAFLDGFTGKINDFESRIDGGINVNITRISNMSGSSTFSIESTYRSKGIARNNRVDLLITYPQMSIKDGNIEIFHHDAPVSRSNWRILYAQ
jgi:hypothetical protein